MAVKRLLGLEELGDCMKIAQNRLSFERMQITKQNKLPNDFDKEGYSFEYVHAEQFGLKAIKKSLDEVSWLPIRLDPDAEIIANNRTAMKCWLKKEDCQQPTADDFGNDFIHALARAAIVYGWDDIRTAQLAARIAHLFKDLSCLVAIAYYSAWIAENGIEQVKLSDPDDLVKTARELAALIRSFAPKLIVPAKEQDSPPPKTREKPSFLHVVQDPGEQE